MLPLLSKIAAWKKRLTGRDLDPIIDRLNLLSRIQGIGGTQVISGPTGVQVKGGGGGESSPMKIFEVQSAATGDGVYNCYEQILDGSDWVSTTTVDKVGDKDAVSVEVMNAMENYTIVSPTYGDALMANDRLLTWESTDDAGTKRKIGVPIVPMTVRLAYAQEISQADNYLRVRLADYKGVAGGDAFDVYCLVYGGSALNAAVPIIAVNDPIFIIQLWGLWYSLFPFMTFEDCDCYTEPE